MCKTFQVYIGIDEGLREDIDILVYLDASESPAKWAKMLIRREILRRRAEIEAEKKRRIKLKFSLDKPI